MVHLSEYEQYSGEYYDPKGAQDKIAEANSIIDEFVEAMLSGSVPKSNIKDIANATDVIGHYAGYPKEAADMESYIKEDEGISYREAAEILCDWSKKMNKLIQLRLSTSDFTEGSESKPKVQPLKSDEDIPF